MCSSNRDRSDAIVQNGNSGPGDNVTNPLAVQGNQFAVDTFGEYGVCDLDGDGQDDLFLATGVSWWFSSGGKNHWVFLNAQDARLDQLGLGDFDGDGRCDIFAVHGNDFVISTGGTGAWRSLGTFSVPFDQLGFGDFNGDGIKDIFRRAPDGQWWAISPGIYDWKPLQSSGFPLSQLRFGDFDGDRITDVIAVQGGRWSISSGATQPWRQLNPTLAQPLASLLIGDIDRNGIDDIIRYVPTEDGLIARWEISWGGVTGWAPLADFSWQPTQEALERKPARDVRSFVGRFDKWPGIDLIGTDHDRRGLIFRHGTAGFAPHSLYSY
jgi:hypothetical protein